MIDIYVGEAFGISSVEYSRALLKIQISSQLLCCGEISCLHINHMLRSKIFPMPCIWANSEFLEAPYRVRNRLFP